MHGFKGLRIVFICFPSPFPDANGNRSKCKPGKILFGGRLRSWEDHHLQLLEGFHTVRSCQSACCQSPTCDAFWFLENLCIQVNCTMRGTCQANRTGTSDSVLVFLKRSKSMERSLKFQTEGDMKTWFHKWLDWDISVQGRKRLRRSLQKWSLAGDRVEILRGDRAASPGAEAATRAPRGKSRSSRSEAERLKDQVLRRLVADKPVPEGHPNQEDSLTDGQNPTEQKPKSPFPPNSNNVNRSSDPDGVGLSWVSGIAGAETGRPWPVLAFLLNLLYADFSYRFSRFKSTFQDFCFQPPVNEAKPRLCVLFGVFWGVEVFPSLFLGGIKYLWEGEGRWMS